MRAASSHGVFVVLVLAGTNGYPPFSFGGTGSPFDITSTAFSNYISYADDSMHALSGKEGIGMFDLWNEPDSDDCDVGYWHGDRWPFMSGR